MQLKISKNLFLKIRFRDFIMRTTNHKNTFFKYGIFLTMTIFEMICTIKYFVFSKKKFSKLIRSKHYNFLLNLFWLYSVNAIIYIWNFKIIIKNSTLKLFKKFIDLEITFCIKHTFLMYSTKTLSKIIKHAIVKNNKNDLNNNDFSKNKFFSKNKLSNVKKNQFAKKNFEKF